MTERFFNINELTDEQYEKYFSLMSEEKQKAVARFRFEDDRKRSVAGEMLARIMISEETDVDGDGIVFSVGENGKPFAENVNIHFNISHSADFVLCAVNGSPVGVDIEKKREIKPEVIKKVCTENEIKFVDEAESPDEKLRRFFEIWTFKEAYFKYVGTGITDFKSVDYLSFDGKRKSGFLEEYAYCIVY